jgi:dTDP-4-dehydrorhamnose 3,5-epimerase
MTKKNAGSLSAVFQDEGLILRSTHGIIKGVEVRHTKVLADERGRLGEIMRADDPWFEKFGQVYFTTTLPGVVKGWHYHKKQTDHICVVKGMLKIALYDSREDSETFGTVNEVYLGEHSPGMVRVPPGVHHGWKCVGHNEAYVVNVVSEVFDYSNPDEYRTDPHENDIPYDWARQDG